MLFSNADGSPNSVYITLDAFGFPEPSEAVTWANADWPFCFSIRYGAPIVFLYYFPCNFVSLEQDVFFAQVGQRDSDFIP